MNKFKINNIVKDNSGYLYKILKVGYKYYTCTNLNFLPKNPKLFKFQVELKTLEDRAELLIRRK